MKLNLLLISGISFLLLQGTVAGNAQQPRKFDPLVAREAYREARKYEQEGNYDLASSKMLTMVESAVAAKGDSFAEEMLKYADVNFDTYVRKAWTKKDWPMLERMGGNYLKYLDLVGQGNSAKYKAAQQQVKFAQFNLGR